MRGGFGKGGMEVRARVTQLYLQDAVFHTIAWVGAGNVAQLHGISTCKKYKMGELRGWD